MRISLLRIGYFILLVIFMYSIPTYTQNLNIDSLIQIKRFEIAKNISLDEVSISKDSNLYYNRIARIHLRKDEFDLGISFLYQVDSTKLNTREKAFYFRSMGDAYVKLNFEDTAIKYYMLAQSNFRKCGDLNRSNDMNISLHFVHNSFEKYRFNDDSYLISYFENAKKLKDTIGLISGHLNIAAIYNFKSRDSSLNHYNKARLFAINLKDTVRLSIIHGAIGFYYTHINKQKDSAEYHLDESIKLAEELKENDRMYESYILRSHLPREYKNFSESIYWLKKAGSIEIIKNNHNQRETLNRLLANDYGLLGKRDSAYKYIILEKRYMDSVRFEKSNINRLSLKAIEIEKEREVAKLKDEENRRILINSVLFVLFLSTIFILLIINIKRRKREIENEKIILIKNQELSSIDAMIEGQEKERQRIANELHDDLGGLLATLKLYVQNLKIKKTKLNEQHDRIIKNTDTILEEAYQKVRSIAQTRNAGVLTSEGLIPTIQNYASKVSASNSLIVEVEDYGMEQRLNNATEILIFRVIQELITNVIKHANATQIIIHITNHEESINVMVEDDGVGFDFSAIKSKKGMGLPSIKKRVENLKGDFDVDSQINRGTTIIIDIPVQ